jgi:hypothetical protein
MSIRVGVSGGMNESQVANPAVGVTATGTRTNIGNITGNMDGKARFWASFESEHKAPRADE